MLKFIELTKFFECYKKHYLYSSVTEFFGMIVFDGISLESEWCYNLESWLLSWHRHMKFDNCEYNIYLKSCHRFFWNDIKLVKKKIKKYRIHSTNDEKPQENSDFKKYVNEDLFQDLSNIYDNAKYMSAETKLRTALPLDDSKLYVSFNDDDLQDVKKPLFNTYPIPKKECRTKSVDILPPAPFEVERKEHPDAYFTRNTEQKLLRNRVFLEDTGSTAEEKKNSNLFQENLTEKQADSHENPDVQRSNKQSNDLLSQEKCIQRKDSMMRDLDSNSGKNKVTSLSQVKDINYFRLEDYLNFDEIDSFSERTKQNEYSR